MMCRCLFEHTRPTFVLISPQCVQSLYVLEIRFRKNLAKLIVGGGGGGGGGGRLAVYN